MTTECIFFFAKWCPYSNRARPIWDATVEQHPWLKMTEMDCSMGSDESVQCMTKYGVEGYPTIVMVKSAEEFTFFNGTIATTTVESLSEFIQTELPDDPSPLK